MRFVNVESSNITKVAFEDEYRISINSKNMTRMRVVFWNGGIYDYYRVPKEVYEDFISAQSAGVFFHKHIKNNYINEKVQS